MPIVIYVSWGLAAWIITAFILGGVIDETEICNDDEIGYNIMYASIYTVVMIGMEMAA